MKKEDIMVPAYSYSLVCNQLKYAFKQRYKVQPERFIRMVGLLFARPTSSIAMAEILPNLDYFHHRSGNNIDFFCGGYGMFWENWLDKFPDQIEVATGRGNWLFSAQKFNEFREEIESMSKWQYSGAVDLILTNARFDLEKEIAVLDFSSTIVCNIEKMKAVKAIESVEMFFEKIFRFAEQFIGDDPTWGFSDKQGVAIAGSALKRIILSLLPKKLEEEALRAAHFAITDASLPAAKIHPI